MWKPPRKLHSRHGKGITRGRKLQRVGECFIVLLGAKRVEMFRVRSLALKAVTNMSLAKHEDLEERSAQAAAAGGGPSGEEAVLTSRGVCRTLLPDRRAPDLAAREGSAFVCREEKAPQKERG